MLNVCESSEYLMLNLRVQLTTGNFGSNLSVSGTAYVSIYPDQSTGCSRSN